MAGLIPLGIGMGAAMTPATAAITESLPPAQQGVGSALNDLSREVGGALGIAVVGSIVTAVYRSLCTWPASRPGWPARPAAPSRWPSTPAGRPGQRQHRVHQGHHSGLLYAAAAALLAAVSVAILLERRCQD